MIELPAMSDPVAVANGMATEYSFAEALLFVLTHEVGHALGGPSHSDISICLMNRYAESWHTVDHLSDFYRSMLRVHNITR
jgi:predicted Zn-dependent protease